MHVCVCVCARPHMCVRVLARIFLCVHVCGIACVCRWCGQTPDGRGAEEGDDGDLAQPLPEDLGPAGHATQV